MLISAGALDSPAILERSGIGHPDVLTAAGVPVVVESPKVGENLAEHRGITMMFDTQGTMSYNNQLNSLPRQLLTGIKYLLTHNGVISYGGYNSLGYFKSDPSADRPDMFAMITPSPSMSSKQDLPRPPSSGLSAAPSGGSASSCRRQRRSAHSYLRERPQRRFPRRSLASCA